MPIKIQLRDDITRKDIMMFLALVFGLIFWMWFTSNVILSP